jgi:branched-chain amino acid transport system permease protein
VEFLAELIVRGLLLGAIYALIALPICLVFATTGSIDMAVGGYAVLSAAVAVIIGGTGGVLAGIAAAVIASSVVALISMKLNRPGGSDGLTVILATFGAAVFLESLVLTIYGKDAIVSHSFETAWLVAGIRVNPQAGVNLGVGLVALFVIAGVLNLTPFGRAMRASSVSPFAATLAGIPVRQIWFCSYIAGGLLAGIAGVLMVYTTGVSYSSGPYLTITAFGAAILFGLDRPMYAFIGGILFGTVQTIGAGYLPGSWPTALPSIFILAVLAIVKVNRAASGQGRA